MARHLLDTDILIWVLRGKPQAVSLLRDLLKNEVPAISTLSVYEIWAGARTQEESAIASFLAAFDLLPVSRPIAMQGADYYRKFRSRGLTLSTTDALIAGTAFVEKLILITQNRLHFPMNDIELRSL